MKIIGFQFFRGEQMSLGPGKYDKQLTEALKSAGAKQGILIVIDGKHGQSFCCQLTHENGLAISKALRYIADQIDNDLNRSRKKEKE